MRWEREDEWRDLLQRASSKATKALLDTLADIAVQDDKLAYKAVCALIVHEMKQLKPQHRIKLLYVMSAILRQSKSRRGERDKYVPRFGPLLPVAFDLLAQMGPEQLASVLKILDLWFRDEIFEPATVAALQMRFRGLLAAARGGGAASSGGDGAPEAMASVTGAALAYAEPLLRLQQAQELARRQAQQQAQQQQAQQQQQQQQAQAQQQQQSQGLQLSSMSPGSFSGAAVAAAVSSQGQPAVAGAPASQVSKAQAAGGESLSSAPPAPPPPPGLHTVGSSSQLLVQQQSAEAYDPLAAAEAEAQFGSAQAGQTACPDLPPLPSLSDWQPMAGAGPWAQQAARGAAAQLPSPGVPPPPPPPPAPASQWAAAGAQQEPPLPPQGPEAAAPPSPPPPEDAAVNGLPPPPPPPESGTGAADEHVGRKRKSRWG